MTMSKKRIVMIGPVYPFKGGISHYTGSMVRSLRKDFAVIPVSFSMQYPKLLFKKEQRDYDNDAFKIEDTHYWINTANPFNILAAAKKIRALQPDYILLQWWHPYFAPCYRILEAALHDIPFLIVCHNVFPHERFPLDRWLTKLVLRHGSGFVTHSGSDAQDLCSILKSPVFETTVLPTFNGFKLRDITREQARTELHIPAAQKLLLFFGFVREYKGLRHLLRAMPDIAAHDKDIRLMVVGEFGSDKDSYLSLIEACGIRSSVTLVDGYIPDKEIEPYFAACDLVVLPYESATQSGIVQIAYSFEKPVIATDVGGLPDVVTDGRTGYLVPPKDPAALAQAVIRYFDENKYAEFSKGVHAEANRYSWDRMNKVILRLTERLYHET